jgi:hypothetical protein
MRTLISVAVLVSLGIAVLAGCAAHQTVRPGHGGTVTGTLVFGGPGAAARLPQPVPGQVAAVNAVRGQWTVTTGDNGRFRFYLPPGTYQLTGHSPKVTLNGNAVECGATHPIHVTIGKTTQGIEVMCDLV